MALKFFLDFSGWTGSIMVLVSYALTLRKTGDFSRLCSYLNLIGGFLIALNCLYYNAMPSFFTNIIWTCIAVISIYRARKLIKHPHKHTLGATKRPPKTLGTTHC